MQQFGWVVYEQMLCGHLTFSLACTLGSAYNEHSLVLVITELFNGDVNNKNFLTRKKITRYNKVLAVTALFTNLPCSRFPPFHWFAWYNS